MKHIVIGVNAFHADSAAALVVDGQLIAAAEEERFRRIKHWAGFPIRAIEFCLREAGVGIDQIDVIAVNTDPAAARVQRLWYAIRKRPSPRLLIEKLKARRARLSVLEYFKRAFPDQSLRAKLVPIEHHLAHLASAFDCSAFEQAVALSVDGFGDFASGAYGMGKTVNGCTQLAIDDHVYFPHSLGIFYQAMTQYLGFMNYGDEYKVMGLAPYGEPRFAEQLRGLLDSNSLPQNGVRGYALDLKYFRHHQASVAYQWADGEPKFSALFSAELEQYLGPARFPGSELTDRHRDLAASVQGLYEQCLFDLLDSLHDRYRCDRLALAGGCAQNSVANGKIQLRTPFKHVYVAASGADAGGAIGAALAAARKHGQVRTTPSMHAYLGPEFSLEQMAEAIQAAKDAIEVENISVHRVAEFAELCDRVVTRILRGDVIGWFQGRMEWGPRALGNRSILADPRRADIKDILNLKIKRRESFRPFAPSILREHVGEWFEQDADVPFMAQVFQIRPEQREKIPAVCHVDGSGRLQTVAAESNPRYYQLISTFLRETGVPILLNTSFNENEPVVCRPQEALACFLRTKMDVLVLGDYLLERSCI